MISRDDQRFPNHVHVQLPVTFHVGAEAPHTRLELVFRDKRVRRDELVGDPLDVVRVDGTGGGHTARRFDTAEPRVFERGAGETMACGTGACGAAVVGQVQGLLGPSVRVDLPGGPLQIEWSGDYSDPVWMTGPTAVVFDGEWLDD